MVLTSFPESDCIIESQEYAAAALVIRNNSGGQSTVTCWKLSKEDLEEINKTGRCYLVIEGIQIPNCYISVLKPFEIPSDGPSNSDSSDN